MAHKTIRGAAAALVLLGLADAAAAHGLIQSPPARNWYCGAITKPDHVAERRGPVPRVRQRLLRAGHRAHRGLQLHERAHAHEGYAVLGPRTNVCGYNSETWNGAATVWDQPIDWPTNPMTAGIQNFTWNISWGPHFSDTEEFRYWITRPGFQYQVGQPLSFSDFDAQPFCVETYNDANPTGNPDVVANPGAATFQTRCTVPQRTGRHVIYAEWGRNLFTFERFHGCVDVVFQGNPSNLDARIALVPNVTEFTGAGTITLDGTGSIGTNLSYQWSVDSQHPELYSIDNANQAVADAEPRRAAGRRQRHGVAGREQARPDRTARRARSCTGLPSRRPGSTWAP